MIIDIGWSNILLHTYIHIPILKRATPGPSDEPQIRRDWQSDAGLGHSQERQPGLSRLKHTGGTNTNTNVQRHKHR